LSLAAQASFSWEPHLDSPSRCEGLEGSSSARRSPRQGPTRCVKFRLTHVNCQFTLPGDRLARAVIVGFRHKGLRQLFEDDNPKGVNAEHVRKLKQILALLDAAQDVDALDYATFRLHALKGDLKGFWSLTVRANWRVIFRFEGGAASEVDLVDYH